MLDATVNTLSSYVWLFIVLLVKSQWGRFSIPHYFPWEEGSRGQLEDYSRSFASEKYYNISTNWAVLRSVEETCLIPKHTVQHELWAMGFREGFNKKRGEMWSFTISPWTPPPWCGLFLENICCVRRLRAFPKIFVGSLFFSFPCLCQNPSSTPHYEI